MNVILLNPPYIKNFIRSARWDAPSISGSNWYPIWLGYCTGLLEKHGHKCKLIDALVDNIEADKLVRLCAEFNPQLLVVYTSSASLKSDLEITARIKEATSAYTVFVGPWCGVLQDDIFTRSSSLNNVVDSMVIGEFDYPLLDLANGKYYSEVAGLWWRENSGRITKNKPQKPVTAEALNGFPFVTDIYSRHLNIKNYFQAPQLYPFIDLFTGRGCCWGKCIFCLWPHTMTQGLPYRLRKIENVIEELKFIKRELPSVKEVFIQDDTLPGPRARELSENILKANLKMTWSCYARPNMDLPTLKLMKKAGCRCLHVGYESANKEILKNIQQGINREKMEEFTENAHKAGLIIHADFIFGLPGETVQTIKETIAWAKKLYVHSYQITSPKVFAHTPLYELLKKQASLKDADHLELEVLDGEKLSYWVRRGILELHCNPAYILRLLKIPAELGRVIRGGWQVIKNVVFMQRTN